MRAGVPSVNALQPAMQPWACRLQADSDAQPMQPRAARARVHASSAAALVEGTDERCTAKSAQVGAASMRRRAVAARQINGYTGHKALCPVSRHV